MAGSREVWERVFAVDWLTVHAALIQAGLLPEDASPDELRRMNEDFKSKPVSAADAATMILDGVRSGAWRILIGEDAAMIDEAVRAKPGSAYDYQELFSEFRQRG